MDDGTFFDPENPPDMGVTFPKRHEFIEPEIAEIAGVAYDSVTAWCEAKGDHSRPVWRRVDAEERADVIACTKTLLELDNSASPAVWHHYHYTEKMKRGWTYGPVYDAEDKTDPDMVMWDNLPEIQKTMDRVFYAVVMATMSFYCPVRKALP